MSLPPNTGKLIDAAIIGVGQAIDNGAKAADTLIKPAAAAIADGLFAGNSDMHAQVVAAGAQLEGLVTKAITVVEHDAPAAYALVKEEIHKYL